MAAACRGSSELARWPHETMQDKVTRWPSLDRVFIVNTLCWTECEEGMKLRGMKRLWEHTSSCIQVHLRRMFQVLAECHEAEQQEPGHQVETIYNLHGPLWLSTSQALLSILMHSRKNLTPEKAASACLAIRPRHPCSTLPVMLSLSTRILSRDLLLKGALCLFTCFHNHILDCRGLGDVTTSERMPGWESPDGCSSCRCHAEAGPD